MINSCKNWPFAEFILIFSWQLLIFQAVHDENSLIKALTYWCCHRTVQVNAVVVRQWILQATQKTSKGRSGVGHVVIWCNKWWVRYYSRRKSLKILAKKHWIGNKLEITSLSSFQRFDKFEMSRKYFLGEGNTFAGESSTQETLVAVAIFLWWKGCYTVASMIILANYLL